MRRRIGIAWAAVGVLSFVLSLPSVRSDMAGWAEWLEWLQGAPWQWVFIGLGLAIIAGAYLPQIYRHYRPASTAAPVPTMPAAERREPDLRPEPAPAPAALPERPAGRPRTAVRDAVQAEQLRRRRIAHLVGARVQHARDLSVAFDAYIDTLLERRHERDLNEQRLAELRAEYGRLQRAVVQAYRKVRDYYQRFLEDEQQYDLRGELYADGEGWSTPIDYPLTKWWGPITFDEAVNTWSNVDNDHIRAYVARQHAVLEAFEEWLGEPAHHELAEDLAGANLADEEILALIRQQVEEHETRRAAREERATFSARQGSISGGAYGDKYNFDVMNTGPVAAAREVRAWASYKDGPPVTGPTDLHTLPPDSRWYPLTLDIPREPSRAGGLQLVVSWRDDSGPREEPLLDIRPLQ